MGNIIIQRGRYLLSADGFFWLDLFTGRTFPVLAGGVPMFTPHLRNFRFYDDDGDEANSTALAAEDVNISVDVTSGNVDIQYRVMIEETGGASGTSMDDYTVETNKNSAGFVDLSASDPGSGIHGTDAGLTNDAVTTNRATDPMSDGANTFEAGEQSNDGVVDDNRLEASNYTEHVWGVRLVSANLADSDQFLVRLRTPTSIIIDITATIDIVKSAAVVDVPLVMAQYQPG